jgi:CRP-like cAMP-binding protein
VSNRLVSATGSDTRRGRLTQHERVAFGVLKLGRREASRQDGDQVHRVGVRVEQGDQFVAVVQADDLDAAEGRGLSRYRAR